MMTVLHTLLSTWTTNFNKSCQSLKLARESIELPAATRKFGGTSIVFFPHGYKHPTATATATSSSNTTGASSSSSAVGSSAVVKVVEWQSNGAKHGRIVDIDTNGNLIPIVYVGEKRHTQNFVEDFAAKILVPQTGVTWTRDRRVGALRVHNKLPEHWQWLMEMWSVALGRADDICLGQCSGQAEPEPLLPDELQPCCQICGLPGRAVQDQDEQCDDIREEVTNQGEVAEESPMQPAEMTKCAGEPDVPVTCPICMIRTHAACCKRFSEWVKSSRGQHPSERPSTANEPPEYPELFLERSQGTVFANYKLQY